VGKEEKHNKEPLKDGGSKVFSPARVLHLCAALIVVIFTFIIYSNTFNVPFLFDDQLNIAENPYIRITELSPAQISRAAFQDKFQLRFLSNLTFGLDYYFHGLDRKWMHAENIALHAAAGVILFFIVYCMIPLAVSAPMGENSRVTVSALAALLWAAHPAHTQAVTYLVQRQTVMATAAALASFLLYIRARDSHGRRAVFLYGFCLVALFVSGTSKEIGWTTLFYLVLFELLFKRGEKESGPARRNIIAVGFLAFFLAAVITAALILTGILPAYLDSYDTLGYGPFGRLMTEARVVVSYLVTLLYPHPVRLAIDQEVIASRSLISPWTTMPAILTVACTVVFSYHARRKKPFFAFAGLGFLVALAPESTLIPVELMYDHRMYLASLFIIPPAVAAITLKADPKRSVPLFLLIALLLGVLTHSRNRDWDSGLSIWKDSIRKSPGLARPWSNYCAALIGEGRYKAAQLACVHAYNRDPEEVITRVNMAVIYFHLNRPAMAEVVFEEAIKMNPGSALARYNYGAFLETEDRYSEAVIEYKKALDADAFHRRARFRRAVLLRQMSKTDAAFEDLKILTSLYPEFLPGWVQMGFVALDRGDRDLAVKALDKVKRSGRSTPDSGMLERAIRTYSVFGGP